MKKLLFIIGLLSMAAYASAQTTPETYLQQLPAPPRQICETGAADKASFLKKVRVLKDAMDRDIVTRQEEIQNYISAKRVRTPAGALPPHETAKTAGAEKRSSSDAPSSDRLVSLQKEQKELYDRIEARKTLMQNRIKTLDQHAAGVKEKDIDPLHRQISTMSSPVATPQQTRQIEQMALKLRENQSKYCQAFSPQYLELLEDYLETVKGSLADFKRMEEIAARTQMGLDEPNEAITGLYGIEAMRDYVALLLKIYKYDLPYEY